MKNNKNIIYYLFLSILIFFLLSSNIAEAKSNIDKKAIVFIMDETDLREIKEADTPNIDFLLDNGFISLMNVRSKSSIKNKGSNYLSLGMGVRTLASTQGGNAFNHDEKVSISSNPDLDYFIDASLASKLYSQKNLGNYNILNLAIEDIKRIVEDVTPNNQLGLLGKTARENNIIISAIGNSDFNVKSREFTMLAMDENGLIPIGNVSKDLLVNDKNIIGGVRFDKEFLYSEIKESLKKADLIFIDYGDLIRVQKIDSLASDKVKELQKKHIIEEADLLIGKILEELDLSKDMFLILSPNPSKNMINKGNFGLTPFILYNPNNKSGLLSSPTTNQEGVVANFDFAPTILDFFNIDYSEFIGEPVKYIEASNAFKKVEQIQKNSLYIRKYRKVFHWIYIGFIFLVLILFCLKYFLKFKKIPNSFYKTILYATMIIPILMLLLPLVGYNYIFLDILYVFLLSIIMGYILFKSSIKSLKIFFTLSSLTSLLILIDGFLLNKYMIMSPLGSDLIAGGRFYGIGNDFMGILVSSSILSIYTLSNIFNLNKINVSLVSSFYFILIALALSPAFGANMGGTLASILTLITIFIVINDIKISYKNITTIGVFTLIIILLIAILDAQFNQNPTHAGKAIIALKTGKLIKLIEIIEIKLRQVFWNLFNSPWSIILFSELIILSYLFLFKKFKFKENNNIFNLNKYIRISLLSSLYIFLFNDTGTIAAGLSMSYLFIFLLDKKDQIG